MGKVILFRTSRSQSSDRIGDFKNKWEFNVWYEKILGSWNFGEPNSSNAPVAILKNEKGAFEIKSIDKFPDLILGEYNVIWVNSKRSERSELVEQLIGQLQERNVKKENIYILTHLISKIEGLQNQEMYSLVDRNEEIYKNYLEPLAEIKTPKENESFKRIFQKTLEHFFLNDKLLNEFLPPYIDMKGLSETEDKVGYLKEMLTEKPGGFFSQKLKELDKEEREKIEPLLRKLDEKIEELKNGKEIKEKDVNNILAHHKTFEDWFKSLIKS